MVREHEDATDLGQAKWRERSAAILERVKRLENLGYSFEGAEASVHLMLLHASPGYCSPFTVLDYSVTTSDENLDSASRAVAKGGRHTAQRARATVKVRIADGDEVLADSDADGGFLGACRKFEVYVRERFLEKSETKDA